jgi:hypothetical protein
MNLKCSAQSVMFIQVKPYGTMECPGLTPKQVTDSSIRSRRSILYCEHWHPGLKRTVGGLLPQLPNGATDNYRTNTPAQRIGWRTPDATPATPYAVTRDSVLARDQKPILRCREFSSHFGCYQNWIHFHAQRFPSTWMLMASCTGRSQALGCDRLLTSVVSRFAIPPLVAYRARIHRPEGKLRAPFLERPLPVKVDDSNSSVRSASGKGMRTVIGPEGCISFRPLTFG